MDSSTAVSYVISKEVFFSFSSKQCATIAQFSEKSVKRVNFILNIRFPFAIYFYLFGTFPFGGPDFFHYEALQRK